MKKTFFLIFCCVILCAVQSHNKWLNTQFNSDEIKKDFLLFLAKSYSSNGLAILNSEKSYKEYTVYARGNNHSEMVDDYTTVIHESLHGYDMTKSMDLWSKYVFDENAPAKSWNVYFHSSETEIVVPKFSTYNSTELNKVIPKEWQKNIFRYDLYVGDGSGVSSQDDGIYGMVEEFNAYYHGTKAGYELRPYYASFCTDAECWQPYFSNISSTVYAYHEFRLFIAWYLKYAKQKHPKVYQDCLRNENLKVAFSITNAAYKKLVADYFQTREEIIEEMETKYGVEVRLTDEYFTILKDGFGSGVGVPDKSIKYLEGLLKPQDIALLESITIEGVTEANYKNFLKWKKY
ncbi:MAG: hypothetical protein ACI81T_002743 [Bacteroidia bacterium]|jgi:hypothetical protein